MPRQSPFSCRRGRLIPLGVFHRLPTGAPAAKARLAAGVSGCLLFLAVFKYYDFFRPYLQNYLGQSEIVDILMPIGASYYTFQSIAYLVETHRAPLVKPFTWANLLLHLSFFPTITSGPIIRSVSYQNKVVGIAQGAGGLPDYRGHRAKMVVCWQLGR